MRKLILLLALAVTPACAIKFEAELLNPFNRKLAGSGEASLIASARRLLAAGMTDEQAIQNLVDRGLIQAEARRVMALARTAP